MRLGACSGGALGWQVIGLLALSALSCRGRANDNSADASNAVILGEESVVKVSLVPVQSGPTLSGTLTATQAAVLRAEVAGTIETFVERGEPVKAGQKLARIESPVLQSMLESARSAVRAAQIALDLARLEEQRARKLEEAGAIARRDLDVARQGRVSREAQLAEARSGVAAAADQLQRATVRAPFEGVVSERSASTGDVVAPGTPLFTVIDPTRLTLEASVPGEQVARLEVGAPVDFSISGYPEETFRGEVDRINPAVDPATRQVRLYASVPNPEGTLRVGVFASGRVATESRESLAIPLDAIDMRGGSPSALRLNEGRTERVPVELGVRDEVSEMVEVLSGLEEGDRVVRGPARTTTEGVEVQVRPATEGDGGVPGPLR